MGSFPANKFGPNIKCTKLSLFKLTDIEKYSSVFSQYDIVYISAGINDISRYEYTSEHLAYVMKDKIARICSMFPNTCFILSGLLPTKHEWVNSAVHSFNYSMFVESVNIFNFNYFDTYSVYNPVLLDSRGNGIHISHGSQQHLSRLIITHITHLTNRYTRTRDIWPLRPFYREVLYTIRTGRCW